MSTKYWLFILFLFFCACIFGINAVLNPVSCTKTPLTTHKKQTTSTIKNKKEIVPAGFEHLDSETMSTYVDVYFMGNYIAPIMVNYNDETLTIHNPKKLVDQLPNIRDKEKIIKILGKKLPTNYQYACSNEQAKQPCGIIEPKVVAVILDDAKLRLDIFVNKKYLPQATSHRHYLPRSNAGASLVSQFDNLLSNSGQKSNEKTTFNIKNDSVLGYKEADLSVNSNYYGTLTDKQNTEKEDAQFLIQNIVGSYTRWGKIIRAGTYSTQGSNFLSGQEILGVGVESQLEQLQNRQQLRGIPIELYLPTPSQIQVYKQGRLIASQSYPAGNVYLNTKNFPTGSYEILIKITDSNDNTTETKRFFVKRNNLPPLGFPDYYINVGNIEQTSTTEQKNVLPRYSDTTLYQLGMIRRMGANWALEENILGTNKLTAAETGFEYLFKGGEVGSSALVATDQDVGLAITSQFKYKKYTASSQITKVWGHDTTTKNNTNPTQGYDPITSNRLQSSLSIQRELEEGNISGNASFTEDASGEQTNIYSIQYTRPFKIGHYIIAGWNVGYQSVGNDRIVYTSLGLSLTRNQWRNQLNSSYRHNMNNDSLSTVPKNDYNVAYRVTWNNHQYNHYRASVDAQIQHDDTFNSAQTNVRYNNNLGYIQAGYRYNKPNRSLENTQYSLSFGTSLIVNPGTIGFSNTRRGKTGFLIEVVSPNDNDKFDVLINGRSARLIDANTPTFIYATPYRSYNIDVSSLNKTLYEFNHGLKHATLYKNNVKFFVWKAIEKYVLIAKIVDNNNKNIGLANVEGGVGVNQIDDQGYLHAELTTDTKKLIVEPVKGHPCEINIGHLKPENGVIYEETLECKPIKSQ